MADYVSKLLAARKRREQLIHRRADYQDFIQEIEADTEQDELDLVDLAECRRIVDLMTRLIAGYDGVIRDCQELIRCGADLVRVDRELESVS